jgi:hypothetical protein
VQEPGVHHRILDCPQGQGKGMIPTPRGVYPLVVLV